ncbi:MAG TPA: nucleotidyltransferase domain-containing protein [Longimicrobium sp.]|nr:nucleotidyltransferase domain-containing protein [Longimicrobium sp.]
MDPGGEAERMGDAGRPGEAGIGACLGARERRAAGELVARVRREVRAELVQALLFGSRARRQARPDSDVDVLLVFRHLPPDREPHAGHAESIAAEVAAGRGVPVSVWSVSLPDLDAGHRTPMLVDALDDAVPLWPPHAPAPRVAFTPRDALFCASSLLDRVEEGSAEAAASLAAGDGAWMVRARDDLVRLCTAALLLAGETRPRRGDAVRRFLASNPRALPLSRADRAVLAWAARSYPPGHAEEAAPVPPPPLPFAPIAGLIDRLRTLVRRRGRRARLAGGRFVRR